MCINGKSLLITFQVKLFGKGKRIRVTDEKQKKNMKNQFSGILTSNLYYESGRVINIAGSLTVVPQKW